MSCENGLAIVILAYFMGLLIGWFVGESWKKINENVDKEMRKNGGHP